MKKKWLYKGADPAELNDIYSVGEEIAATETTPEVLPRLAAFKAELVPGKIFEAPADWLPVPNPHPLFEPVADKPVDDKPADKAGNKSPGKE